MNGMSDQTRTDPGFAPAAGERGAGAWRAAAIGCSTVALLGMASVVALLTKMVLVSGLAADRSQESVRPAPDPIAGGEAVVARSTDTEEFRFSDSVETLDESHGVAGTVPTEYPIRVDAKVIERTGTGEQGDPPGASRQSPERE